MNERISHAALLNMESEAKPWSDTAMLIAEVRRLRGLIVRADDQAQSFIAGSQDVLESDTDLGSRRAAFEAVQDAHDEGQPWSDFVAEARAIREEQDKLLT